MKIIQIVRKKKGQKSDSRRRGVALITVLTIMSLATILVMTFFTMAQNEHNASSSYSDGLQAQAVAEEAVNMVIRQIRKATSNAGRSSSDALAWASQPGAIRTWDMQGHFEKGYKLYSDDDMEPNNEESLAGEDFQWLGEWDAKPWAFVDLNEPVIRGERVYYPIVDPIARDLPKWPTKMGGEDDKAGIEGFSYDHEGVPLGPMADVVSKRQMEGVTLDVLPMPAMWLYQLKDGTLGYLEHERGSRVFLPLHDGGSEVNEENPIVARFAFWADDETCKLNVNTAAGGASWATPMAGGDIDRNLGRFQPAQHEWQRYPGHPATTHLAPVLAPGITDITYQRDNMELIFELVPRVVTGGSMSGTTKVSLTDKKQRNGLIPDRDRLYPSLDEFIMKPDRKPNRFPKPGSRGDVQDDRFMQDQIERMKFFLTVLSRAPEVTIFNTPRVSIWPTYYDREPGFKEYQEGRPGHHTTFDRLIRFCAEIGRDSENPTGGRHQYHFQRANEDSSTYDFEEIQRNKELFYYLEKLTRTRIPGAGGSFQDKYPEEERHQILTEIFDYVRSTNLHDDTVYQEDWKKAFSSENDPAALTYTNGRRTDKNDRLMHKGHGQVTPIRIDHGKFQTKGMGRFYTLLETGVQVICCADGGNLKADIHRFAGPPIDISYGITEYGVKGYVEEPFEENDWSNLPPLPSSVRGWDASAPKKNYPWKRPGEDPAYPEGSDPHPSWAGGYEWLETIADYPPANVPPKPGDMPTGQEALDIALNPENWNWQLAWLDSKYEAAMPEGKFEQNNLLNTKKTRLERDEKLLQAILLFQMFTPSLGWVPINPDLEFDIQITGPGGSGPGMEFDNQAGSPSKVSFGWGPNEGGRGVDLSLELESAPKPETGWGSCRIAFNGEGQYNWVGGDRFYGGVKPATYFMRTSNPNNSNINSQTGRWSPIDRGYSQAADYRKYNYVTRPFKVSNNQFNMSPGEVTMKIWAAGDESPGSAGLETEGTASKTLVELVQELHVAFPELRNVVAPELAEGHRAHINEFGEVAHYKHRAGSYWSLSRDGITDKNVPKSNLDIDGRRHGRLGRVWSLGNFIRAGHRNHFTGGSNHRPGDVLYSVGVRHGDARMVAARPVVQVSDELFTPHHLYKAGWNKGKDSKGNPIFMAHNFASTPGNRAHGASGDTNYNIVPDNIAKYHGARRPYAMSSDTSHDAQRYGDFDNGMGNSIDGPYINKPDEGNTHSLFNKTDASAAGVGMWDVRRDYGDYPYFVRDYIHESGTPSYFSPNRIISSPGMFGSLPVGTTMPWNTQIGQPWRTLLFRPQVNGRLSDGLYDPHPGAAEPKDHYFLDLFWMPVVEPYAISEPLSTAGKVNMNYQILPYKNIKRNTALRGVFKSEYMLCIPNQWARDYKVGMGRGVGYHWRDKPFGGTLQTKSLRSVILEGPTLEQFEDRFKEDEIFKTASEICDIHLVPEELSKRMGFGGAKGSIGTYTPSVEDMEGGKYWRAHSVVGDNGRERPYSNIYARLTTKSNTFKVHYRAQVVTQANQPGRDYSVWDERLDTMNAEYRGSTIVERYVEPNDPEIPDYTEIANDATSGISVTTIDEFYKFRVVNPTRFAP